VRLLQQRCAVALREASVRVFLAHARGLRRLREDVDDVRAEARDLADDLLPYAGAERDDDDDGRDADENAEHRERRAELRARDRAKSESDPCDEAIHVEALACGSAPDWACISVFASLTPRLRLMSLDPRLGAHDASCVVSSVRGSAASAAAASTGGSFL